MWGSKDTNGLKIESASNKPTNRVTDVGARDANAYKNGVIWLKREQQNQMTYTLTQLKQN